MVHLQTPNVRINLLHLMKGSYMRWYDQDHETITWYISTYDGWNGNLDFKEMERLEETYERLTKGETNDN